MNDAVEGIDQLDINDSEKTENIEVITDSTPMSYSSILKTAKKQANIPGIIKIPTKEKAPPPEEVVENAKKCRSEGIYENKKPRKMSPQFFLHFDNGLVSTRHSANHMHNGSAHIKCALKVEDGSFLFPSQ